MSVNHRDAMKIVQPPANPRPDVWYEVSFLANVVKSAPLPVHDSVTCPNCGHTGVTLRGEECDCHACDYRWIWPYPPQVLG